MVPNITIRSKPHTYLILYDYQQIKNYRQNKLGVEHPTKSTKD